MSSHAGASPLAPKTVPMRKVGTGAAKARIPNPASISAFYRPRTYQSQDPHLAFNHCRVAGRLLLSSHCCFCASFLHSALHFAQVGAISRTIHAAALPLLANPDLPLVCTGLSSISAAYACARGKAAAQTTAALCEVKAREPYYFRSLCKVEVEESRAPCMKEHQPALKTDHAIWH